MDFTQTIKYKEITTYFSEKEMRALLVFSTKIVHFSMNGEIYLRIDGVAIGSLLGPTLTGIFMVQLERCLYL